MSLLVKSSKRGQTMVALEEGRLEYVGFAAYRLSLGETLPVTAGDKELCLVLLSGRVTIQGEGFNWENLGDRHSVFEDKSPFAAYLPPGTDAQVTALSDVQIAVCAAPGSTGAGLAPRLIRPEQCKRSVRGKGANTRYVCDILPDSEPAHSLLVVEVRTPSGHSSSYRPTSTTPTICRTRAFSKKPTTTRSTRPRALCSSGSTPTTAASTRPWPWKTATWWWCPRGITRSACRMATSLTT